MIRKAFVMSVHAGREYLAMDYFPRGDLKARMHQGISESEAVRYVSYIASALRVVHHAGALDRSGPYVHVARRPSRVRPTASRRRDDRSDSSRPDHVEPLGGQRQPAAASARQRDRLPELGDRRHL